MKWRNMTRSEAEFEVRKQACDWDRGYCYHCRSGGECPIRDETYKPDEESVLREMQNKVQDIGDYDGKRKITTPTVG